MLVRALIPDPAAIRTGRAMSMLRLEIRCPLLLAYPALLGRLWLARAPRAHLRLIVEFHGGRLWATCQPCGALFQFAILLGRHDQPIVYFWAPICAAAV